MGTAGDDFAKGTTAMHRGPQTSWPSESQHSDPGAAGNRTAGDQPFQQPADTGRRLSTLASLLQETIRGPFPELMQTVKACEQLLQQQQQWQREREELQRQQSQWEHERQEQLEQLESEYLALQKAWDEVETQRRAVASGHASGYEPAGTALGPHQGDGRHAASTAGHAGGRPPGWIHGEGDNMDVLETGLSTGTGPGRHQATAESNDFAFQQLRREIRKHSRRQY